jgi:hypothetical protein
MDDIEYELKNVSFPQIPEEMLNSIALGMEDDLVIASRHGYTVETYQELEKLPWFQVKVAALRSDFEKNGVTFKAKAGWMASELLDKVYVQAASSDASLNQRHEVLKTLIKAGGLEPKEEKSSQIGTTFSIQIDLGSNSVSLSNGPNIIEINENSTKMIDIDPNDLLDE